MNDLASQPDEDDTRPPRRREWDAWLDLEKARHIGKGHEFVADRDFDEDHVEGHGYCRGCA